MNPGKMKNRIAFYRFVTSSDSYGGFLSSGETLVNTVWGYSKAISGEYVDQSGQRQRTNEVEVIIRKKTFDIVDNNEMTFKIDGSGSYRINDVFESDIDKYITLKGTLVT
jgi:head-tail adaptor|tara:strand:- start:1196 stop:1525 length:330 start_codon:yes stop_codon:yes gene_type:complete